MNRQLNNMLASIVYLVGYSIPLYLLIRVDFQKTVGIAMILSFITTILNDIKLSLDKRINHEKSI